MSTSKSVLVQDLKQLAKNRLDEAEALFSQGKYEAAIYLGGYAIELTLKAVICQTLQWTEYPSGEVSKSTTFITHDLETLSWLSGKRDQITRAKAEWTIVSRWEPEMRYDAKRVFTQNEAKNFIDSVKFLMSVL